MVKSHKEKAKVMISIGLFYKIQFFMTYSLQLMTARGEFYSFEALKSDQISTKWKKLPGDIKLLRPRKVDQISWGETERF